MKKNVKYSKLIDIQLMDHRNLEEPLTKEEATIILKQNHIPYYPSMDGHSHTIAVPKSRIIDVYNIPEYNLLDSDGTEISHSEVEKIFCETLRPEKHPSSFDLI
ncbi:MAG: hypothetical protein PHH12_02765 [Candidatus Shapirobacteria bacterium]|jgi:hypothetical protein|nr:hypothetical protein [Candidatus Shapirobacteria bacterium]